MLAISIIGMNACASNMSKKECETADYYQLGLDDGRNGREPMRLRALIDSCANQGFPVPTAQYTYGRDVGLAQFCSEKRLDDSAEDRKKMLCPPEKLGRRENGPSEMTLNPAR